MRSLLERMKETMTMESIDEETTRMIVRLVVVRISTKHINLWMRQLEMKRNEIMELAGLMGLEGVQEEIEKAKDLEIWAKRCTTHFTKKVKRKLFEAIDNMAWSGDEEKVSQWCKKNVVFDEITEEEIEDILNREGPDEEPIRLNGKYVWETAKKVCGFINAHEDLIHITTFGEYKEVMKKVMRVIKEDPQH